MRAITSFALLVPLRPLHAEVRSGDASPASPRRAKAVAIVALVSLLALTAHATIGNAQGRAAATSSAATAAVAPTVVAGDERWAADESRDGTRPDAAH